jgi:CRISPR/Cas system endoribonuclease Cas6 (RAMP superfamily)
MTEPLPDLATALFRLQLHPDYPMPEKKEWYGKAIRAIFLNAVREGYSRQTSAAMHTDNQLRAYSVSNLITAPGSEAAQLPHEFTFRISVCQKEALLALLHCTLPGNQLAPGSHLNLSGLHCQITAWHLIDQATYADLVENALNRKVKLNETIDLFFESPVYFKDTKTAQCTAAITPTKVFGSLLSKWQINSTISLPGALMAFIQKHVFINTEEKSIVEWNTGNHALQGSVGLVRFISDSPKNPAWSFLHCLARFAEFSGVGKDTAIGFGQTCLESEKVTFTGMRAKE